MNLSSSLANAKRTCYSLLLSVSLLATASVARAQPPGYQTALTTGAGTSTITDLTVNPDGTLTLQAVEQGSLTHFGSFTGSFTYLATIDDATGTTYLDGTGVFVFGSDELKLTVHIVEFGQDYPKPYFGLLTVTGGTGRFQTAFGSLAISGTGEESLTDGFKLEGLLGHVKATTP